MDELRAYLLSGHTPEDAARDYALVWKRHAAHPHLVGFKYNQTQSPMAEPIVQEARGIVLDESDGWRCVCRPWAKFWNHGEALAAPDFDWSTVRVQEKVDGSATPLWYYRGAWHVSTLGRPDAAGTVNDTALTFAGLFWQAFDVVPGAGAWLQAADPGWTYLFELTAPESRVVVYHPTARLTLLGARHAQTGRELWPEQIGWPGPVVREYTWRSADEAIASFEGTDGRAFEGYVAVDAAFRRLKIKHPGYLLLHRMKSEATAKHYLDALRQQHAYPVFDEFPEISARYAWVRARYEALVASLEADYARARHLQPKSREFAEAVRASRLSSALFSVHQGKVDSIREALAGMALSSLAAHLGVKETAVADGDDAG